MAATPVGAGDNHAFGGILFQGVQKGGFAGPGFSGQENMEVGIFNKTASQV